MKDHLRREPWTMECQVRGNGQGGHHRVRVMFTSPDSPPASPASPGGILGFLLLVLFFSGSGLWAFSCSFSSFLERSLARSFRCAEGLGFLLLVLPRAQAACLKIEHYWISKTT